MVRKSEKDVKKNHSENSDKSENSIISDIEQ